MRIADDAYYTPAWCVHRLLDAGVQIAGDVLEPCAGDGAIIRAVGNRIPGLTWTTADIAPRMKVDFHGDFLSYAPGRSFDCVISNPPYILAESIVRHSLTMSLGTVIMLLRLNWLASCKRQEFLKARPPDVYVLPNRPSFTHGGTDMTEYAWFVWNMQDLYREKGSVQVLDITPLSERRHGAT